LALIIRHITTFGHISRHVDPVPHCACFLMEYNRLPQPTPQTFLQIKLYFLVDVTLTLQSMAILMAILMIFASPKASPATHLTSPRLVRY